MPGPLETSRLVLRPLAREDRARLVAVAGRREIADTTISVPHPFETTDAEAWIEDRAPCRARFAVAWRAAPERLVGYAGLHDVSLEHAHAELSFWIEPEEAGQGLATEAAGRLIAHAFDGLDLNRISAFHMVRNAASERVLRKLGLQPEGLLRQRGRKWGRFEDVRAWALLRQDWSLQAPATRPGTGPA